LKSISGNKAGAEVGTEARDALEFWSGNRNRDTSNPGLPPPGRLYLLYSPGERAAFRFAPFPLQHLDGEEPLRNSCLEKRLLPLRRLWERRAWRAWL